MRVFQTDFPFLPFHFRYLGSNGDRDRGNESLIASEHEGRLVHTNEFNSILTNETIKQFSSCLQQTGYSILW